MSTEPDDLAVIGADDALLDLLAAGGTPGDGDEVAAMLAAWRDDIAPDLPRVRRSAPAAAPRRRPAATRRTLTRSTRILLGAAAAVVVVLGGIAGVASDAGPDSPLWPVAQLLYPARASSAVAEQNAQQAIDDARQAIGAADYTQAQTLLDTAAALVDGVTDPTVAQRLRDQIDELLQLLSGVLPSVPLPSALPTGVLPSVLPTGVLPTGVLPSGLLPSGLLPSGLLPSGLLPSGLLPSCIVPSGILPPLLPSLPGVLC